VSRVWSKGKDGYRLKPSQAYSTVYWQAAEGFGPGKGQGKWKTQQEERQDPDCLQSQAVLAFS